VPDTKTTNKDVIAVAQEIKSYLAAHPNAADSVEGVVKWWLTRQRYEQAADEVQQALDYLIAEGMVSKITTAGGRTVYSSARPAFPKNNDD
jgi:hypothetical protein